MNEDDFSNLSDDELRALIESKDVTAAPPGKGAQVAAERRAGYEELGRREPKALAEEIEPSAFKRGMAAMGGAAMEPILGLKEKLELAFPGRDSVEGIGRERAKRREIQRQLEETPAGQFGSFVGKAAPFAGAPFRAVAQAALAGGLGFLEGGPDRPSGLGSELSSSGFRGLTDAAATGLTAKGVELFGKGISGARGQYTPSGQRAMELNEAAGRVGLRPPTIGQLDPHAPGILRSETPKMVAEQGDQLAAAMQGRRTAPSPAGGREEQLVPGGRLREGLEEAVNVRRQQARGMYEAVDDFAAQNSLSPITPNYTLNVLRSANKLTPTGKQPTGNNIVYNLLDTYDPDAFMWLKQAGSTKAARQQGMSMTQYHDARVAVGRALNSLERKNQADLTADQIDAKNILKDLKAALDNDVERWATHNKGNEEAMGLYNRAKEFYHKTASEAINNPLSKKLTSKTRGFGSPEQMLNALMNPANRSLTDRLLPTASRETRDLLNVLQNLPDVGPAAATGRIPSAEARGGLGALAASAVGHPVLGAMRTIPGAHWMSSTIPAKKLYFGAPPTSRALGPLSQYPAGGLETWAQERTSTDRSR